MDFLDALKAGGASATIIAILAAVIKLAQSFCGNRIRSECCGHTATAGVSVEPITPPHSVVVAVQPSPSLVPAPTPPAPEPIAI